MSKTRKQNLVLNVAFGYIAQVGIIFLSFIGRKIFLNYLSVDYLGINGLYTNILSVLSLAELGLGSVVAFSLYKPVADDNKALIRGLLKYFKKLYRAIALVITIAGLILVPFLKYIITSDLSETDLIIYYLLFLTSTVSTYFVTHKVALLLAYQENRIQKIVTLVTALIQQIVHIFILLLYPNYMVYVASTIICSILSNILLSIVTNKKHPYINKGEIADYSYQKKYIKENIKSSALYKLSLVAINSTDNILISVLVSTATVGIYSNYLVITNALQAFISIITSTLISSVGNLYAEKNKKQMISTFNVLVLCYHFISCFCSISLYYLFNTFIGIWIGKEYLMNNYVVFAISLNFYLTNLTTPIWSFREATGQFTKVKYVIFITAALNIVFSIILGSNFGVFGILMATIISKLLTIVWYEPRVLFKNVFFDKQSIYWKSQLKYLLCTILCFVICKRVFNYIINGIFGMILFGISCLVVCFGIFYIFNFKSDEIIKIKKILFKKG